MKSTTRTLALAILIAGLGAALPVFAQSGTGQTQAETPAMKPNDMRDMMQGGDMGGMMGMMQMMAQMNEMKGACTKMMQAMTPTAPMPDGGEAPANPG